MLLGEFKKIIENKLLADDVPIIINTELCGDSIYTVTLEQNQWGRWAIMIDVDE